MGRAASERAAAAVMDPFYRAGRLRPVCRAVKNRVARAESPSPPALPACGANADRDEGVVTETQFLTPWQIARRQSPGKPVSVLGDAVRRAAGAVNRRLNGQGGHEHVYDTVPATMGSARVRQVSCPGHIRGVCRGDVDRALVFRQRPGTDGSTAR